MFTLRCKITIGGFMFTSINDVKIKRSIHSFIDTATILLPASARLNFKENVKLSTKSVSTAKVFNEGDPVEIWLGYNNEYPEAPEFKGFIKRVNAASPCEIECEGYSWQLRRKNVLWSSGKEKTTLKKMLEMLIDGTDIKLSNEIPDIQLEQVCEGNISGTDALDWIKKNLYLTVYFSGHILYAGLAYIPQPDKTAVEYTIGWNLVKDDQLKFRKEKDVKIQVKAVYFDKRNKAEVKTAGDSSGAIRTIFVQNIESEKELLQVAERKAQELRYDGYEGKVTGFLVPFALPGYRATLKDAKYKERDGTYLIESTEVKFGTGGARRISEIGVKISKNDE